MNETERKEVAADERYTQQREDKLTCPEKRANLRTVERSTQVTVEHLGTKVTYDVTYTIDPYNNERLTTEVLHNIDNPQNDDLWEHLRDDVQDAITEQIYEKE